MRVLKSIRFFYIIYTVYTIFVMSVSDYNIVYAGFGIAFIWMLYFAFFLGFCSNKKVEMIHSHDDSTGHFPFSQIADWKWSYYIINAAICWVSSILAAKFYTSRGFISVIKGAFNGAESYSIYQHYLSKSNISTLTFSKIPYVLMLTFCTAMLFWGVIGITLSGKRIKTIQFVYLALIIFAYLYFGLARGTNFEMYIVFILLVYCLMNRSSTDGKQLSKKKRRKYILYVLILGIIVVLVFRFVVESRGIIFNNQISPEIHYKSDRFIAELFPTITNIGLSVFRYLGFGIFSIGVMLYDICLYSFQTILSSNIPCGFQLFSGKSLQYRIRDTINVGVGWVPDGISLVNLLGIPLLLLFIFAFGRITAKCLRSNKPKLLIDLICMIVFMEMLSIPVGNFIITSTPNKLTVLAVILWYLKCSFSFGKRYKRNQNSVRVNQ